MTSLCDAQKVPQEFAICDCTLCGQTLVSQNTAGFCCSHCVSAIVVSVQSLTIDRVSPRRVFQITVPKQLATKLTFWVTVSHTNAVLSAPWH